MKKTTISDVPEFVQRTALWKRMSSRSDYVSSVANIRSLAEKIAAKSVESMRAYTDHTVKHMDALWTIADQVLSPEEMRGVDPSEAFVLGATFYVHDLGMSMSAMTKGEDAIRASEAFRTAYSRLSLQFPEDTASSPW
jgi:hypothetical protein